MFIRTYSHGLLQASPFAGFLREPLEDLDACIAVTHLTDGFMLPVVAAYQHWQNPMLIPIEAAEDHANDHPFGQYELFVRISREARQSITIFDQYMLANYLVSVGLLSHGGLANNGEAERIFASSLIYSDIRFWQGIEAAIHQLLYIATNQLPAEGIDVLDDRARQTLMAMPFPAVPHNVARGYENMSFRLGRFASFHAVRRIIYDLLDRPLNSDINWLVREYRRLHVPEYPGRAQMRNPEDAVPFIDMPE